VNRVHAVLKRPNARSRRLLERLGFSPVTPAVREAHAVPPDELMMDRAIDSPSSPRPQEKSR
jgi:RimJ/RimL family protein N-acetyltransferase